MTAMYAPAALEPHRWVPGDGFQLQQDAAPYRILRRQRFDFLTAGETLIFEGCRALYRPPAAADWVWDGALRIWVQVNFGPAAGLLRRGAALLCGEFNGGLPAPTASSAADAAQLGAFNILPEILDRRPEPEFEVVVLDLRGGRSLPEIREDGWAAAGVPCPFEPAGAIEILRRLVELNQLAVQAGLCLAMLHPDQVMVDENLNLRIRGLPWLTPIDDAGRFPADWTASLAARASQNLVQAPDDTTAPPDGRLCLRWLAAFVHYLVTGRWEHSTRPLTEWLAALYRADNRRAAEPWEIGLLTRLWEEQRPQAGAVLADLMTTIGGPRRRLLAAQAQTYCYSISNMLNLKLEEKDWSEVLRLATVASTPLPAVYAAAQAAAVPSDPVLLPLADSAHYTRLNALLDRIARLEAALERAEGLARQTPGAGGSSALPSIHAETPSPAPAPAAAAGGPPGFRPTRYGDVAPLPAPTGPRPVFSTDRPASPDTADARPLRTVSVNAYGVPVAGPPSGPPRETSLRRWLSPLKALAGDLADVPPAPAFQARLIAWLESQTPWFTADWIDPPLTAAEQTCLADHAPALLSRLPALLNTARQTAATELAAAAAACADQGARELPRFDRALRRFLRHQLPATGKSRTPPPAAEQSMAWLAPAESAVTRIESAKKVDAALLARLIAAATEDRPEAQAGARIGALCRLAGGLRAAQAAMTGEQGLTPLAELRAALDDWPQYPVLQERWRQALDACLLLAVAGLERAAAAAAASTEPSTVPPPAVEQLLALTPETVLGLVELLHGPADSNRRWLGDWLPRIEAALRGVFRQLALPGGPLAARLQLQGRLGPAWDRWDAAAAAACRDHLTLTEQRRIDLRAALTAGRAQAAWGKALALWSSGETTLFDDAGETENPGFAAGEDLGRRALGLWLEQSSQAIEQLARPTDPAALAALIERLLAPLTQAATLLAAPATTVSVTARDLTETGLAIEAELFVRMAWLTEDTAQFAVWAEAWGRLSLAPRSPRWQAVLATEAAAPVATVWREWLTARGALAQHQLETARVALVGAAGGGGVARLTALLPAEVVQPVLARWAEAWDRQRAATIRVTAQADVDVALAAVAADLAQVTALNAGGASQLMALQTDLQARQRRREVARTTLERRRQTIEQALADHQPAAALAAWQAFDADWPAAEWPAEQRQRLQHAWTTQARAGLQQLLTRAEQALVAAPPQALADLQAAAAGLAADDDERLWPDTTLPTATDLPTPAAADLRPALLARLQALFEQYLAGQTDARYGGALYSGLSTGALPPDAPFWAALILHHRLPKPTAAALADLRALPVGALGPEEWLAWLTATQPVFNGREQTGLAELRGRVAARWTQLQADLTRLQATVPGAGAALQAREYRDFIAQWRIGRQVAQQRAALAAVEAAAQAELDAALPPPPANWLIRPFLHWRGLTRVREAAAVMDSTAEQSAAEKAALAGCLWRLGGVLAALAALAAGFWLL